LLIYELLCLRRGDLNRMLGNLIGGFVVILVGTSLAPTVAQQVGTAQADGNITGASDTLLGLTTLFYCLAIATAAIGIAAVGLRNSGMI
jgi:xanthine/uracil permease